MKPGLLPARWSQSSYNADRVVHSTGQGSRETDRGCCQFLEPGPILTLSLLHLLLREVTRPSPIPEEEGTQALTLHRRRIEEFTNIFNVVASVPERGCCAPGRCTVRLRPSISIVTFFK